MKWNKWHTIGALTLGIGTISAIGVKIYSANIKKQLAEIDEQQKALEEIEIKANKAKKSATQAKADVDKQLAELNKETSNIGYQTYTSNRANGIASDIYKELNPLLYYDFSALHKKIESIPSKNHYLAVDNAYKSKYNKDILSSIKVRVDAKANEFTQARYDSIVKMIDSKVPYIKVVK